MARRNDAAPQAEALVGRYAEGRTLFVLNEPCVNVLRLNLALDGLRPPAR